jgi:hypothetical protein
MPAKNSTSLLRAAGKHVVIRDVLSWCADFIRICEQDVLAAKVQPAGVRLDSGLASDLNSDIVSLLPPQQPFTQCRQAVDSGNRNT